MQAIDERPTVPRLTGGVRVRLDPAGAAQWRVVDATGRIIGHLQALGGETGVRYRARRFHPPSRAFRELGEFWSADDAVESLRFAR